ncbi:MAG: DUF2330 domain-containing protein [Myxococcales bacterium]|nr:DUF2330 domain-containing protein [Myxococcales bacterium]
MRLLVLVAAATLSVALPRAASACGGCFSPPSATTDQVVVQDAERVLFVRDAKTKQSTVWVEVRYSGLAKDFGWVLPLPKVPQVGVGSAVVFDALDTRMALRYALKVRDQENCRFPEDGCVPGQFDEKFGGPPPQPSAGAGLPAGGSVGSPNVEILAQGQTGPYDYVVVKGSEANVLYEWLTKRGYATPAKAKPILQSHIDKGDVFVAIKLSNGQGVNAIRPLSLVMDDAEPCVPLRLTSIAAQQDMAVIVTVAGPGRAVVKNHLDVEPNPLRMGLVGIVDPLFLPCPQGSEGGQCRVPANTGQVLAAAIDEAGGRAFVTESAIGGVDMKKFSPLLDLDTASLKTVPHLLAAARYLDTHRANLPLTEETAAVLAKQLKVEAIMPGVAPLQAMANLRACGQFWNQFGGDFGPPLCNLPKGPSLDREKVKAIGVDGVALADAVMTEVVKPVVEVAAMLGQSSVVTRLQMRISPEEMDRDPIFAYSSTLPLQSPARPIDINGVCLDGWLNGKTGSRITLDGLGSWVFNGNNAQDVRFKDAPAALRIALHDESGPPLLIGKEQIALVDTAIKGAVPGKPSLPQGFTIKAPAAWVPPKSDPIVTTLGPWKKPFPWCKAKRGWEDSKLPPAATLPPVMNADAGAQPSGPVAGVDAAGGWNETTPPATGAKPPATPPRDDSGCTAGARGAPSTPWLGLSGLLSALGVAVVLRRRKAPAL